MSIITTNRPAVKLTDALEEAGYKPGAPDHITPATKEIDRQVCRFKRRSECGKRGQGYLPFTGLDGQSYHIVAVCPRCSHQEEL